MTKKERMAAAKAKQAASGGGRGGGGSAGGGRLTEMEGQLQQWRSTRYRGWQEGQQDAGKTGLRPALLRLALASLLQPRLAADAPAGTADLPGDVVGRVGAAVEGALQFSAVERAQLRAWLESEAAAAGGAKRRALLQGAAAVRMLRYARNRHAGAAAGQASVSVPVPRADL
jgi:hypothetical protein